MPIPRVHSELNISKPLQRQLTQAQSHRIPDHQRPDERRTADCRTEQHTQMPAPVEAQAASNQGSECH